MSRAYYSAAISDFLATNAEEILGKLNLGGTSFTSQFSTTNISWNKSVYIFKDSFRDLAFRDPQVENWRILLEYEIPRLMKRIDAVIIAADVIFVIEYKDERSEYNLADIRQVEDYALDLSHFHLESRNVIIVPILLAPLAAEISNIGLFSVRNNVKNCIKANSKDLSSLVQAGYTHYHDVNAKMIDHEKWENSEYKPTPTIIQAAKALFAGQRVQTITRSGADANNLTETTNYVINVVKHARANSEKVICFVTGVPGAGKTLVGLNLVHQKDLFAETDTDTAYFSGNGPLINVLREALSRDNYNTEKELFELGVRNRRPQKGESERKIKSKIQNLHSFIKEGIRTKTAPPERVVIFDEAQRCWNAQHFYNKSKRNENRETNPFDIQLKSEAELLFEFMDRHDGWAVIVALVGGGQEINTGEGGIAEWGQTLNDKYSNWQIHVSPELIDKEDSIPTQLLFEKSPDHLLIHTSNHLHLKTSQRSFKANNLNAWVNALIANDKEQAFEFSKLIKFKYPILITRNLSKAKDWLKNKIIGADRVGLVASSGARRLRANGINVKEEIDEAYWFLNDETDVRSSYYLEIVATEYAVQGLELDWIGVCWDADLRRLDGRWDFKNFSGTSWDRVTKQQDQQYLLNTYRVLLTRARQGLIIFVPEGDDTDPTRSPTFYDPIYQYLKECGVDEI